MFIPIRKKVSEFSYWLLLVVALLLLWTSPSKSQGFSTCFVQPTGLTPIPCAADSSGNQGVYLTPGGGSSATNYYVSAALEGGHVVSTTDRTLIGVAVNPDSTAGWFMLFDATSIPANGAVTPKVCIQIPLGSTTAVGLNLPITTGITVVFSSTGCYSKTLSATATFMVWSAN